MIWHAHGLSHQLHLVLFRPALSISTFLLITLQSRISDATAKGSSGGPRRQFVVNLSSLFAGTSVMRLELQYWHFVLRKCSILKLINQSDVVGLMEKKRRINIAFILLEAHFPMGANNITERSLDQLKM